MAFFEYIVDRMAVLRSPICTRARAYRRRVATILILLSCLSLTGCGCRQLLVGAEGLGDPYFPKAGNAGYDVLSYDTAITTDPLSERIESTTVINSTATQDLDAFDLDFLGPEIIGLSVGGEQVDYDRDEPVFCPRHSAGGPRWLEHDLGTQALGQQARSVWEVIKAQEPVALSDPGPDDLFGETVSSRGLCCRTRSR